MTFMQRNQLLLGPPILWAFLFPARSASFLYRYFSHPILQSKITDVQLIRDRPHCSVSTRKHLDQIVRQTLQNTLFSSSPLALKIRQSNYFEATTSLT